MFWRLTLPLLCCLFISACSTPAEIHVDSITAVEISDQPKRYTLKSGMDEVDERDLYFQNFSQYIHHILAQRGFEKVPEEDAELIIKLQYAIDDGHTTHRQYSVPVYESFAGETYTIDKTRTDSSGTSRTVSKLYVPPSFRVVGREVHTEHYTVYTAIMTLDAVLKKDETPLWRSSIRVRSPEAELRNLIPMMCYALQPYVATNTGRLVEVNMSPEDKPLQQFIDSITGVKE